MISVAFLTVHDRVPWLRQTPGGLGHWKSCSFRINQGAMEADWLVVYDDPKGIVRTSVPKRGVSLRSAPNAVERIVAALDEPLTERRLARIGCSSG